MSGRTLFPPKLNGILVAVYALIGAIDTASHPILILMQTPKFIRSAYSYDH